MTLKLMRLPEEEEEEEEEEEDAKNARAALEDARFRRTDVVLRESMMMRWFYILLGKMSSRARMKNVFRVLVCL